MALRPLDGVGGSEQLAADLVVDASGRGSRVPAGARVTAATRLQHRYLDRVGAAAIRDVAIADSSHR